uniref:Leukocyte immunoglobulin-like receptor subfamily A member 5 isoform 1 n=2 Tax=Sus scrofa TaxID=9823 RepID=A0A480SMA8_PIG
MSLLLPMLLFLGFYPGQNTQEQNGNLSPPLITALPGSLVPPKQPVTILCRGPKQAEAYRITRVGSPEPQEREANTVAFPELSPDLVGPYHCSYKIGEDWSPLSNLLYLVMTEAYEKPSLSSMTGTVVASGENVKLQCFSKVNFEAFILIKNNGSHTFQEQSSTPQGRGAQAIFLLSQVSSAQAGTYRCCGVFNQGPFLWSQPSNQVQLQVKEATDPDATESEHPTARPPTQTSKEKRLGLLIGAPVASGLLLLVLLLLVCCCRKARNNAASKERRPEAAGPTEGQASEAPDPQEVTYCQLTCSVPQRGTAGSPSLVPRQTQTSEYATLALR